MRENKVGLLAVAFMCLCGVARSAPIVYSVNIPDVTGTITTDGTIGMLAPGDFIAWHLSFTDNSFGSTLFDSTFPGSEVTCGFECAIATPEVLELSADSALYFSYLFNAPLPPFPTVCVNILVISPSDIEVFSTGPAVCPEGGGGVVARLEGGPPYRIGNVPEPGTITLLGLALAGLGFARKRSQGRQSTAV